MSAPSLPIQLPVSPALSVPALRPLERVQVAPGHFVDMHPSEENPPRHTLTELIPVGGGLYRQVTRLMPAWLPFNEETLRKVGISISKSTLHRLGRANLIRVRQTSPSCYEFHYDSWLQHCAAVEADPEFWEKEVETTAGKRTRFQLYREAL
ncbi:hypothetical protein [Geminisphaera colitermitum]|uniref:hypothetical protein n=1 Tax=Geminisphaera colitermitum TaxID=1148786 RepID=UPI000158CB9F|nr:hypothetical protein [Geminisphaera colitermitum]